MRICVGILGIFGHIRFFGGEILNIFEYAPICENIYIQYFLEDFREYAKICLKYDVNMPRICQEY